MVKERCDRCGCKYSEDKENPFDCGCWCHKSMDSDKTEEKK